MTPLNNVTEVSNKQLKVESQKYLVKSINYKETHSTTHK